MNTSLTYPSLLRDLYNPCSCITNSISLACSGAIANCLSVTSSPLCSCLAVASPPPFARYRHHRDCRCHPTRTGTVTVTAIAIGVVVVVIPIGAAATIDAAIWTRCHCRHVWAPIGSVVVNDDAVVAEALAAPPLLPSGATDPTDAALTKTRDGTVAATATVAAATATATATATEECDRCGGADPRRRLDNSLLLLADVILLRLIVVTMVPRCGCGGVWQPR